jgi:small-conductance mechanosensitive channel
VFPGLNEVIPQSNAVSAGLTAAEAVIAQADSLDQVQQKLADLAEKLKEVETQFTGWEDVINWPLNRLMTAETRYSQIDQEQKQYLDVLAGLFKELEDLREKWTEEKDFWQNWHEALRKSEVKIPEEVFTKTLQNIDELLGRISEASTKLLKMQEEFSAEQEILASRLILIDKTLKQLRQEIFRRNAYSLFSLDFYHQLTPELFAEYRANFISTIRLPDGFWQRHGWVIILQLISTVVLMSLLSIRRKRLKPISSDWRFLFKHPIAGAVFITLAATGGLYDNIPPSWGWLMLTIATIAGTVLVAAMAENNRRRRLIIALAIFYLLSEVLKVSGLPTPAYQLYEVILCAIAAPACLLIARIRKRQEPGRFGPYLASLYLISLIALVGLITALLGFATLSIHLIEAVLGTIIIVFMVRMAMHLADGGITEFLRLNWVRERQLVMKLGISTDERLKTLARIFILINAGLYLLVVWGIYNDVDEALATLFNYEYTIGGFSISIYMVAMVTLVLYLTNLVSWVLQAVADAHYMTPRKIDYGVKAALKRLLHYSLFTVGFFVAISMAGLDLQKFTIIAGALSVGIGFGLQNIVNNFVSGLILLFERPVKVGDTINIDDQWGTITRIGMRSTVFETLDRSEIIVPNSDLISQKVTNWTFTTNISRIVLTVGVAYGSPLDKVLEILKQVAQEHPDILDDPESSAIFTGFGESSIDFELRVWIADINKRLKVKSELGQAVDRYFREEGITIPFPQRDLHLRSIEEDLRSSLLGSKPAGE